MSLRQVVMYNYITKFHVEKDRVLDATRKYGKAPCNFALPLGNITVLQPRSTATELIY